MTLYAPIKSAPYSSPLQPGVVIGPHSMDFEEGDVQLLTNSTWGSYTRAKFAISLWYKRESVGAFQGLVAKDEAAKIEFVLGFDNNNKLNFATSVDGTNFDGILTTTAAFTNTSAWHHLMVWFDSANATAGNRMRMWHDGTEITSFSTDTNPTAAVFSGDSPAYVAFSNALASGLFDGKLYQVAFFNNSLPAIGDVYNGGKPKLLNGVAGLYSLLESQNDSPKYDSIKGDVWTNLNNVVNSLDTPWT